jgi:hypothetical protein
METKTNLQRRAVVGLCLSLPFSLLYAGELYAGNNLKYLHSKTSVLLREVIETYYGGFEQNYFGNKYLESHGTFIEIDYLEVELGGLKNAQEAYLKLEGLIRQDYIKDKIVFVEGWMFSNTEIRINALRHLYSS